MHGVTKIDTVIYARGSERPWHGLATEVDARTVVEAMAQAKLKGWNLQAVQLQVPNPITGKWESVDRWAIIRTTDGRQMSTVGAGYRIVQNEDAFELASPFVEAGQATIETAGSLFGGGRVWMLLKIKRPDMTIVSKADDRVAKYMLVATGHDGSLATHAGVTATRVVCNNTLSIAVDGGRGSMIRVRHSVGAKEALKAARETIDRVDRDFEKAAEVYRALAGKYVTEAQIRAYVDAVFPPPKVKPATSKAAAIAAEWDDGPTSPDVTEMIDLPEAQPAQGGAADFASLLGKPAAAPWTKAPQGIEAEIAAETARREREPRRVADNIVEIFEAGGQRGDLNLPGVKGTAWGAYNAVTEYLTWHRGRSADNRLNNLWFQDGGVSKRALTAAADTWLR